MGIDAVAVIKPPPPSRLRSVLDPDRDSVVVLDDDTLLISTFIRLEACRNDLDEARGWLSGYGVRLLEGHDDPRGVLFFPDVAEPRGRTYDEVVAQVEDGGVWVPASVLTPAELQARQARLLSSVQAMLGNRAEAFERTDDRVASTDAPAEVLDPTEFGNILAGVEQALADPNTRARFEAAFHGPPDDAVDVDDVTRQIEENRARLRRWLARDDDR